MKILGIDPGTATTGYGMVEYTDKQKFILIDFGLVSTSKDLPHGQRLDLIYRGISDLLVKHTPDVVAIERLFFATNALTAIAVGQAIGVIKLAIHNHSVPVFDYAPMQVKLYVGGSGKADKTLMKNTVKKTLSIRGSKLNEVKDGLTKARKNNKTHFDDAADALALAICHVKKINKNASP